MLAIYADEESFQAFCEEVQQLARLLQPGLKMNSNDKLELALFFPFRLYCAFVEQFHFDRKADVEIRCAGLAIMVSFLIHRRNGHEDYYLDIYLSQRKDLELLLGADAIAPVNCDTDLANGHMEICCDKLFPVLLRYCTKTRTLRMKMDYVTGIERLDEVTNEKYLGYYKPAAQARKEALRGVELEKRLKRTSDDDFIDSSNIVKRAKLEGILLLTSFVVFSHHPDLDVDLHGHANFINELAKFV